MKTVIFSDLDGTLLDSRTYSFQAALPALELVREREIPLVLCSSKTRAEMELCRERLNNNDPFIVENGGGIFVPAGYFSFSTDGGQLGNYLVTAIGAPYDKIRKEFSDLRKSLNAPVKGFADMTVREIADLTGFSLEEAVLAKARDFGEPFIFEGDTDRNFLTALEERGLHWTQGKLYHAMGDHDKGKAVRVVKKWYEQEHGKIITIGIGDALNDLPMLREVDRAVLIRKPGGKHDPEVALPGLIRSRESGPAGWNQEVLALLKA